VEFSTTAEYVLFYMACISSGLFLIKMILMLVGGDIDDGVDFSADAGDTDTNFGVFSINSILCFLMTFGWSGFAAINEWGINFYPSMAIAFVAGSLAALLLSSLLFFAKKLEHEPDVPTVRVGDTGQVYTRIPAAGVGKISISNKIMKATSEEDLDSFVPVRVLEDKEINSDTIVKVEAIHNK